MEQRPGGAVGLDAPRGAWDAAGEAVCLADAHCHVDFSGDAAAFARAAQAAGVLQLSSTVTPEGYDRACELFGRLGGDAPRADGFSLLRIGVGLHPWWVAADEAVARDQVRAVCGRIPDADFVGEVGLDFSARHAATANLQVRAFERVAQACASAGGKMLSIHAVRSATAVLDALERSGALASCRCVLHWFSGTSDELTRARRLGCWFSVGERMLATKRGRAYLRQMPAEHLLLETDLPARPGDPLSFKAYRSSLARAYDQVAALRGEVVAAATVVNALHLVS